MKLTMRNSQYKYWSEPFFDDYAGTDTTFSSLANGVNMMAVSALNGSLSRRSGFYPTITFSSAAFDSISVSGFKFSYSTNVQITESVIQNDCYFNATASGKVWSGVGDGNSIKSSGCTAFTGSGGSIADPARGNVYDIDNLTLLASSGNEFSSFSAGGFNLGGGSITCIDSDLSAISGTLIGGTFSSVADTVSIKFDNCEIASGVAFTASDFKSVNHRAIFTR